jgi:DNA-directed RNA polymerase subunit E'/Rpb7
MDPLFERRELVRNVHLDAKFLQRNITASLLAQLRMKFEGTCLPEGYVQPRSIVIVEHSLGRANLIKGGLDYMVKFQADICMPHAGQVFRVPVTLKSKIGIHSDSTPLKVLLPRDLHIGNAEFDEIEERQNIEFEVVGIRFQQGDETIVVLGKLRTIIRPAAPVEESAPSEMSSEPIIAAPVGGPAAETSEKKVVTVDLGTTKPEAPRRVRIRTSAAPKTNE